MGRARWAKHNVRDWQVHVSRAVGADVPVTLHQFVELQAHQAGHRGRGGGDGWDDPPGDALTLWRRQQTSYFL